MITEALLNFFFLIANGLFDMLPDVHWNVDTGAWQYLKDILDMIGYFLPIGTVTAIITLIIMIAEFRILIAIVRTVWGFIPFV